MTTSFPRSTYRLQLHAGFTLHDAASIVPYLSDLGISHVYTSPFLQAKPGSTHGYDVTDHHAINGELGGAEAFEQFARVLIEHGMGLIADIVPNHVGISTHENTRWDDVLEHGPASRFAGWFDIAWRAPLRPAMQDRVLLPLLGQHYARALEAGELKLKFESGAFRVYYDDRHFPVAPCSYDRILLVALDELAARAEANDSAIEALRGILELIAGLPGRSPREPGDIVRRHEQTRLIKRRLAQLYTDIERVRLHIDSAVAAFNGHPGEPGSFDRLDDLLSRQAYRLAYWRVAPDEINYRRFFDINDLAALCMERQDVFEATHELILSLISRGHVSGLRIDHPDGLYDPGEYLERLQAAANKAITNFEGHDQHQALYVVVEKILEHDEELCTDWPVAGTTGYDLLNQINGVFVDPAGEEPLSRQYRHWTGDRRGFADVAWEMKLLVLERAFSSELNSLARMLDDLAQCSRRGRDFTLRAIRDTLRQIIACFGVYRTYLSARGASDTDRRMVDEAIVRARQRDPTLDTDLAEFIRDTLTATSPSTVSSACEARISPFADARADGNRCPPASVCPARPAALQFIHRFQQLTAPVTARGIEDTTFYLYNRLVSLNEVGGDPGVFGITADELHRRLARRQRDWPHAMSTLSTHDTKRSEDVRARINVLSEIPHEWEARVNRWSELNTSLRPQRQSAIDDRPPPLDLQSRICRPPSRSVPDANDEYLLYQTLAGTWPFDDRVPDETFVRRIQQYMLKAVREAKAHTTWMSPNTEYESGLQAFIAAILDPGRSPEFLEDFRTFARRLAQAGMVNSLAQTLLRLTAPGVPDTYQGTELWDLSLVDPDNRRPVDYALRRRLLEELKAAESKEDRAPLLADLLTHATDGRIKLFVTRQGLAMRNRYAEVFAGEYLPLQATGAHADRVFAFARRQGTSWAMTIVPRLIAGMALEPGQWPLGACWGDSAIRLPDNGPAVWRDVFTGGNLRCVPDGGIPLAGALARFPVALLAS